MALLSEFSEEMINSFSKDLSLLMNTVRHLDEVYADGGQQFGEDKKHFKKLILQWNKKYPLVNIKDYEDGMQLKFKVLLNEKNIHQLVAAAANIDGLDAINGKKIMIGQKPESSISKNAARAELTFKSEDDENTLTFEADGDKIALIYSQKDMLDKDSPEFKICCYYGLKSFDDKINLQKLASFFSFDTDFEEMEGKGEGYLNRVRLFDKV
jgi:hypothetical protein